MFSTLALVFVFVFVSHFFSSSLVVALSISLFFINILSHWWLHVCMRLFFFLSSISFSRYLHISFFYTRSTHISTKNYTKLCKLHCVCAFMFECVRLLCTLFINICALYSNIIYTFIHAFFSHFLVDGWKKV